MPHLWTFLLQSSTPAGHEVVRIDDNAQPVDEAGIARYVREQNIGLVGIGAMTRMIAKPYPMSLARPRRETFLKKFITAEHGLTEMRHTPNTAKSSRH